MHARSERKQAIDWPLFVRKAATFLALVAVLWLLFGVIFAAAAYLLR
jgi:hypothetical protein